MCIRDRLGAPGTGKTCLIRRYCSGTFDEHAKPTMGFDFLRKRVTRQESTIEFQIWDTAGQDTFASLTRMYYKGTHGVLLVYDITLSLIHICRCRRYAVCRSRWSPYH
eukprot:TRINITY_DN9764_c0_g1_i7.p1 TRINITY_DN9764_c0_g1~~TRINITY_DN9764_c0_g1_i7.p1  ORF type:complete len:123 (+),score=9.62 TRINITY_DN9764_c0_g1_i7:47-370(+)